MGAHTHGQDDAGEPRRDPGPAADAHSDLRVAAGSADLPPHHHGDDPDPEPPAEHNPSDATTGPGATSEQPPDPGMDAPPPVADVRPRRPGEDGEQSVGKQLRDGWRRVVNAIAAAVMILAVIIAVVLALHIVFEVFDANKDNGIVQFVNGWATGLAYGFRDLFVPKDAAVRVTVNYGLAAVVYLVAGRILAGIIRRLG